MFIPDPWSDFFPSRILDPGYELSPSRILDPGSRIRIKEFKYFNPKKPKNWFLSSGKYDPGCSSRIPDPGSGCWLSTHPGSRIPDPGVKKAPDPGSGSATLTNVTDCPSLRPNWLPPPPLPQASVSPPGTKGGGGQHLLVGEGAGGAHSDDWRESLALYGVCILCGTGSREGRGRGMSSLFPVWKENRVCSDDEDRDGGIINTDCKK